MDPQLYKNITIVNTQASFTGSIAKIEVLANNFTGSNYNASNKSILIHATASLTAVMFAQENLSQAGFGLEPTGSLVGPIHIQCGKSLEGPIRRFENLVNSVPVLVYTK